MNAIIPPVGKCRMIFRDKSKVKIFKYYLSIPYRHAETLLYFEIIVDCIALF